MADKRTSPSIDPGFAIEAEVRANVLAQPIGFGTVADLNLTSDFVGRIADRAVRETYYERHRAVVHENEPESVAIPRSPIGDHPWAKLAERTPALASFRSPEVDGAELANRRLNGDLPPGAAQHQEVEPRRIVRQRLQREGLLPTIARVVLHLRPEVFLPCSQAELERLASFGVPIDLIQHFALEGVDGSATGVVEYIARQLEGGIRIEKLEKTLRRAKFVAPQSLPGFRPTSESGADMVRHVRMQLARDQYFLGPGDGGALDLCEGVLRELADCDVQLNTARSHESRASQIAEAQARNRRIRVIPQDLALSQWAGDNAKAGSCTGEADARRPAQITPRFAARREDAPIYMPGDDWAVRADHDDGIVTKRSPWLFEGGNLLVCDDLKRGDRVLLIGEAEIFRNMALGLTREQAHEALLSEFAVHRGIVLPAASYHIDQEVTVRSIPDARMIAFVPDVRSGVRIVVHTCLEHLGQRGRWPTDAARRGQEFLKAEQVRECLTVVWELLARERRPDGSWPGDFAALLSTGTTDSGEGNLHRLMLALDLLAAEVTDPTEFSDGHLRAVLRSFVRREQDRRSLRSRIEGLGWAVVSVPAMPEDSRGVNPLNGVHEPDRYCMPAYGGLMSALDTAAKREFEASLNPMGIRVSTVMTAESQRRQGALHCAVSVFGW